MNAPAYTDTEKRLAKRLKKLATEEAGSRLWSHTECLALVRKYAAARCASAEEFVAMIYEAERVG
jgi:hypothetical protein